LKPKKKKSLPLCSRPPHPDFHRHATLNLLFFSSRSKLFTSKMRPILHGRASSRYQSFSTAIWTRTLSGCVLYQNRPCNFFSSHLLTVFISPTDDWQRCLGRGQGGSSGGQVMPLIPSRGGSPLV
jgi:hypothetical protein